MTLPQDITKLQSEMSAAVREHWKAFLIEGILLVILGLAAMIVPPLASLAVTIFLGWMFLISGVAGLVLTFWARQMPGFWWSLLSAVLGIAAGRVEELLDLVEHRRQAGGGLETEEAAGLVDRGDAPGDVVVVGRVVDQAQRGVRSLDLVPHEGGQLGEIFIDMHNDMPSKVLDEGYDPDIAHPAGDGHHTDLPRLLASGLTATFFASWVDAKYTFERAMAGLDVIHAFVARPASENPPHGGGRRLCAVCRKSPGTFVHALTASIEGPPAGGEPPGVQGDDALGERGSISIEDPPP